MSTILILTVGGASAPILSAIRERQPTFVVFVTSKDQPGKPSSGSYVTVDGPGEPCDVRPAVKCPACKAEVTPRQANSSIVARAGLAPTAYQIVQIEPDDLNEAYADLRALLADLRGRFPDATLVADYTGGTKTMSAALTLAAIERGDCELALVAGRRGDLVRVTDGTQMSVAVDARSWRVQRSLTLAEELFDRYDYAAAEQSLAGLLREVGLTPALRSSVQRHLQLCRGFDAWDRFDHATAFALLEPFAKNLGAPLHALLALVGRGKTSGYEPVFDLVRNAERRAARARLDDAVARLYRATELLAQVRLHGHYKLNTSDLVVATLPEPLRARYGANLNPEEDGKVRVGLQAAYTLLGELNDPLGAAYTLVRAPLHHALFRRNHSILAHGLTPVTQADYADLHTQVRALLDAVRPTFKLGHAPAQFPKFTEIAL
ncbi:MAG: TIGR02710 family CRISPR-associated CARF protein [Chloroflexales bacterium]